MYRTHSLQDIKTKHWTPPLKINLSFSCINRGHNVTFLSGFPADSFNGIHEVTPAGLSEYIQNYTNWDLVGVRMEGKLPYSVWDVIRFAFEVWNLTLLQKKISRQFITQNQYNWIISCLSNARNERYSRVMQCSMMPKRNICWIVTSIWLYWTAHFRSVQLVWCMRCVHHLWWSIRSVYIRAVYRWLVIRLHMHRRQFSSAHSPTTWICINASWIRRIRHLHIQCIG